MNPFLEDIDIEQNHYNVLYPELKNEEISKYYHIKDLNTLNINPITDLLLLNFNIRSLSSNYDQFLAFSHSINKKINVISFTESWLKNENKQLYGIDGYKDFHSLRDDGRRGGGISVYVSNDLEAKIINDCTISINYIETLCIEIHKDNKKILLMSVYKPNKSDDNSFIEKLSYLIDKRTKYKYDEIIISGDFNFNLLKCEENGITMNFMNSLSSLSLVPVITKPTRITEESATLIDNIFTSNPNNFNSGIIITDISDHFPVFFHKTNIFLDEKSNPTISIEYRLINDETLNNLYDCISSYDFSYLVSFDNPMLAVDELSSVIDDSYRNCCPIKTKTISYKDSIKPWITKEIINFMKKRHNYFILYRKKIIPKKTYSNFRNFVTKKIRKAKFDYFEQKFNSVRNNIKQTWRIINDVLKPRNKSRQNIIKKIIVNNSIYERGEDIANIFNDFFVNVGKDIADSVDSGPDDHLKYLNHINQPNSFFFRPITPNETYAIINTLKNKPSSINNFSIKILKFISKIICIPLTNIINQSFIDGIFPDSLKIARITPVFKEGDKSDTNNYRPISVLSILSKIFEKAAYSQLYNYLELNTFLNNNQFGFRTKKSTTHAIINYLQYLYTNLDNNKLIFSIFLDFRKAFDSVNHNILLSKLRTYGIRGQAADWFRSYLDNRKQYVYVNGSKSHLKTIKYGVPQGSILGPLLFLIFINDITESSKFFKYILYADDSTLSTCISEKELEKSAEIINDELNKVYMWLNANKIALNKKKTNFMVLSYNNNVMLPIIKMGPNIIEETDVIKFLGLHIDNHLTFRNHISIISSKISKSIGLLFKLNKFLPSNILKMIYIALINPYITYAIEAWYGTFKNNTNKIFILQKRAIRAINSLDYNDHTNSYFKSCDILKLDDQYKLQVSSYIYKLLYQNADCELKSKLSLNLDIHDHNTRQQNHINIPRINRARSKFSLFHNGFKIWNSLPENLRKIDSLTKFRNKNKSYYNNKY